MMFRLVTSRTWRDATRTRMGARLDGRWIPLLCLLLFTACAPASAGRPSVTPTSGVTATPGGGVSDPRVIPGRPAHQYKYITVSALDDMISHMSLDEKLGQLFIAEFVDTDYNQNNAIMVEQQHAGGILLYAQNIESAAQTRALIAAAQAHAKIPLFTTVDEEGGWVDRLEGIDGFRPSASMIGATGDPAYARKQGAQAARDMSALGLNFNLAPDVDVGLVQGQDLRSRVFGSTPQVVTQMAGAYLQGLQASGHVVGTIKHFPGLGSVLDDAHLDLPTVKRTLTQLQTVELAPYRALVSNGQAQVVMPTDVLVPALDPKLPAELSPKTINGYLRGVLGFKGVVITDALYMAGISNTYSMPQAAVMSIEAGDDLLVGPAHPDEIAGMLNALRAAVQSGQISMARIDQSVKRILLLKIHMKLMPMPTKRIFIAPKVPANLPN